jgi:hypothetical protein
MIQRETRNNYEKYKEKRRIGNKICTEKKKEMMKVQMQEIENLNKQNEIMKFYAAVKKMNRGYQVQAIGYKNREGEIISDSRQNLQR